MSARQNRGRRSHPLRTVAILSFALTLLPETLFAQNTVDVVVLASAAADRSPARITLSWPSNATATGYSIYRKPLDVATWGSPIATLPGTATSYVDTSVVIGTRYEYRINRSHTGVSALSYLVSGIELPQVESRGKVLLLVDDTQAGALASELARLQQDLVGDGWIVIRHDVPRTTTPARIKSLIKREYGRDPASVKAVFLLGHIPVPYSGAIAPDGHGDHYGAWPADPFYGDLDGSWTDVQNYDSTIAGRLHNVAGDGKYDNSDIPSAMEIWVGRVDLANMPAFAPKTELDLLRQYLNKDHNFRHRIITAQPRGLIDDNFGYFGGEAFAASGWRNFSAFFGAPNVFARDWFTTLSTDSYLWAYGCGGGSYTSAGGVGSTAAFAATDTKTVFTMLFGSYHGDWDTTNNFLRAPLATATYGLTNAWSGRPHWQFHHMATGDPIGRSAQVTMNNTGQYVGGIGSSVHAGLMGDPTLRMHPVAPPANLNLSRSGANVILTWSASIDSVIGYHVYHSPSPAGPYIRITGVPVSATSFTHTGAALGPSGTYTYRIHAIKLEVSGSGSYFNSSQGLFGDIAAGSGALTSDLAVNTFADPPSVTVGTDFEYSLEVANHGPSEASAVVWSHQFPAGINFVSVTPSTGCSTAGTTLQCTVGTLSRGSNLRYRINANAASAGSFMATSQVSGAQADSNPANSSAISSVTVLANAPTTTLLSTSANPVNVGASITLTATVLSDAGGAPSGTVTFREGTTTLGSSVLSTAGKATLTSSTLPVGLHVITAQYSGDSRFSGSTSANMTQTVRATTSTALSSSLNPAVAGQAVTFTATVSATSGTATGTVSFRNGGTAIGSGVLNGSAQATFTTTTLPAGTHSITAMLTGGGAFAPSTSPAVSQVINAATGAATTTVVTSTPNPSNLGQTVTLVATVTSPTSGTPTGTVLFRRNGAPLATAALNGSARASVAIDTLPAGTGSITATYNGDGSFNPSTAAPLSHSVKVATTVALISSPNPSTPGQTVTFTATVSPVGGPANFLSGQVTFAEGSTTLATRFVNGARQASFITSTLSTGTHSVVATYAGDASHNGSASPALNHLVSATSCNPAYGDLNQDGNVNAVDLVILANFMAGNLVQGPPPFTAGSAFADLNRSGRVDAVDLVLLQNYMSGNITCLPF